MRVELSMSSECNRQSSSKIRIFEIFHTYAAFETEFFFRLFMYHYPDGLVARENARELI